MLGIGICVVLAIACLVISILQFMEKGPCFNNAYLYASREERERMNKKPHYRQSAIGFLLLFLSFLADGIYAATYNHLWLILQSSMIAAAVIYAIVSSIRINRK